MNKTIYIILGLLTSFCLGYFSRSLMTAQIIPSVIAREATNAAPKKVTGIAGIFFTSKDPKKLKEWYKTHLGFNTDQYGARFVWQEAGDPPREGSIQWSTFPESNTYFQPSVKDFMINYSVDNLSLLAAQLKNEGVTIVDSIETYEYGKFLHIMDIEGNKIELYEPDYSYKPAGK